MSLMKTLAKVAVGVAVAKGASAMMRKSQGGGGAGGGLGGLLGGLTGGMAGSAGSAQRHGGAHSPGAGGGLEDMLGGLLGGGAGGAAGGMPGGLGGLLEQLGGAGGGAGGGLGGLLGGLASGGGLGGLLGGAAGGAVQQRPADNTRSFGEVLNSQFDSTPEPAIEPSRDQEAAAALMLSAMIQAAKSDGTFDEGERDKLLGRLGDVDAQEAAFVNEQLQGPVDVDGLVAQTPKGLEAQVYAMSLLGIDLDTQQEAQHLHKLAQGFGMSPQSVNAIHEQMGVPSLYT
ncbi:tellurite resistance TerB family protein [uncultured Sulfitobacter sp.]|uniref:tellurite resistance TerB family protein n=1 Tax=uncultured Sulfitobacter sp. TaxID=191468 RepID=UPI0026352CF6|nr:tellurite resistance TerB family protein [uncultured Sulfitobacter sp.]